MAKLKLTEFNNQLLNFLHTSTTPFHAVFNIAQRLEKAGYKKLEMTEGWSLKPNGKYYITGNDSTILAFKTAAQSKNQNTFRIFGAHTDSPSLKVKPQPDMNVRNYFQLGIEVYGGALLNPWFDRDLSMAGRVSYLSKKNQLKKLYIDFKRPVATIPSLAIHLDRTANENKTINKQKEMPPLVLQNFGQKNISFNDILLQEIKEQKLATDIEKILEHEIFLYDTQAPQMVGLNHDFIASARLDNLLSCFIGTEAFLDAADHFTSVLVCHDHEEVGSCSHVGADSTFVKSILERITETQEAFSQSMHKSFMISCDNAHALHPNYTEKHDVNHGPMMNAGPVIKMNANQRYATNSDTASVFAYLCESAKVPYQKFVVRSDMSCGSTIGPITASQLGIRTVDVGTPQFAMHSIRELTGAQDPHNMYLACNEYFKTKTEL